MRKEEALWVGRRVCEVAGKVVLELGSSTEHFRTVSQPHVDEMIHAPLRRQGVKIYHSDLKPAEGVDIVGDIYSPSVQEQIRRTGADTVLCCNMFEHVENRNDLCDFLSDIVQPGCHLIVTVPYSYPIHLDPIDTGYRPSPDDLAVLFGKFELVESEIVVSTSFLTDLLARPGLLWKAVLLRTYWLLAFWVGHARYTDRNHRLLWLFRPYKVSCVLLRRT